jgi:hypothetical protein
LEKIVTLPVWWLIMLGTGLIVGCIGAWTTQAARVFMKTLATPLSLFVMHLLLPRDFPARSNLWLILLDIVLFASAALLGDYVVGLLLGRHDKAGFRSDSVGH